MTVAEFIKELQNYIQDQEMFVLGADERLYHPEVAYVNFPEACGVAACPAYDDDTGELILPVTPKGVTNE